MAHIRHNDDKWLTRDLSFTDCFPRWWCLSFAYGTSQRETNSFAVLHWGILHSSIDSTSAPLKSVSVYLFTWNRFIVLSTLKCLDYGMNEIRSNETLDIDIWRNETSARCTDQGKSFARRRMSQSDDDGHQCHRSVSVDEMIIGFELSPVGCRERRWKPTKIGRDRTSSSLKAILGLSHR